LALEDETVVLEVDSQGSILAGLESEGIGFRTVDLSVSILYLRSELVLTARHRQT